MSSKKVGIIVALLTLAIYYVSVIPATKPIVNSLFVLYVFIVAAGILYWPLARNGIKSPTIRSMYFLAIFTSMLLWVGVTGWFFSPFFYFIYIVAVMLAFMYSPFATMMFIAVLIGLFAPNVGSIDMTLDIVTIVSLMTVVPLTYFLQKEYLTLKQAENKVLILEEETSGIKNKVDSLLLNKIIHMSVDLRQPVNDMRQIALVASKGKHDAKTAAALHKIIVLGRESLDQIERFEEKVTGTKLVHTGK